MKQLKNTLNCEQVYNVWATDPQLIALFDLRSEAEFKESHIPGAIHIEFNQLISQLGALGDRLAVIVGYDPRFENEVQDIIKSKNCVLMRDCHRWKDLQKPLVGQKHLAFNQLSQFSEDEIKSGESMKSEIIFHQLFEHESSTYTYLIADTKTKEAALIDPVLETVERDLKLIEELGLNLVYVLDTHIHADHITGAGEIRKRSKAKTGVSVDAGVDCVDMRLEEGQELLLGDKKIKILATPGHTDTCLSYVFEGRVFTGDALLIRGCGRTDFQQGSSENLYKSVREKLFQLPDETVVYPGHDYRGQTSSTIGTEKKWNARLNEKISLEDFKKIMSELKLAHPKKIHEAVPANLTCGQKVNDRVLHPQVVDGTPEISCEEVFKNLQQAQGKVLLVDVRRPEEYVGELGHVEGAKLVTLGPDLTNFLQAQDRNQEVVFLCRSGARSGAATQESIQLGFKKTINMVGGMIRWNELKFPVVRTGQGE